MGRTKKQQPETIEDVIVDEREFAIRDVAIKDHFCHYSYELLKGISRGDIIQRKGSSVVHPDMLKAFERLNVHLAVIDDAFHYSQVKIDDIDRFHGHDITDLYKVTAIRIKGEERSERAELTGSKHISNSGRIKIETPAISMTSAYLWYNELKAAVDNICREVELYMAGKFDPDVENDNQLEMFVGTADLEKAEV